MHKMAFAHVFGPEKKNGFGPFPYKFFVCIRVGLSMAAVMAISKALANTVVARQPVSGSTCSGSPAA